VLRQRPFEKCCLLRELVQDLLGECDVHPRCRAAAARTARAE
jgi:hypothetical protein